METGVAPPTHDGDVLICQRCGNPIDAKGSNFTSRRIRVGPRARDTAVVITHYLCPPR